MTLKCKIKEVGEMVSDPNFVAPKKVFPQATLSEADSFEDKQVDIDDEEFEMQELGTIEEISHAKERKR